MRISILAVGKIKDKWLIEGVNEYWKRLQRFGRVDIIEISMERIPANYSPRELNQALVKEGHRLLANWPEKTQGIALSPHGKSMKSEELAAFMDTKANQGQHHITFFIGGSNGLSPEVYDRCHQIVSFGSVTFPHQLFRVILLEQIYRAEKIRSGEIYHK